MNFARLWLGSVVGRKPRTQDYIDPKRQVEYFRLIVQECDRLGNLIENLLNLRRQERGQNGPIELHPVKSFGSCHTIHRDFCNPLPRNVE